MPLDHRLRESLRGAADDVRPDVELHLAQVRQRSRRRSIPAGPLVASVTAVALVVVLLRSGSLDPLAMVVAPGDQTTIASSPAPVERAAELAGTYSVHLDDTVPDGPASALAGDWELTLGTDSSITLTPPDTFDALSTRPLEGYAYAIRGDRLFTNLFSRHFGQGCLGSGAYRWERLDAQLTIEAVDDTCLERIAVLTTASWILADG